MAHSAQVRRIAPDAAARPGGTSLLRLVTCGNVDDGKSTLVGRLLHDTGCLTDDQVAQLHAESRRKGLDHPDFSLVFDGLGCDDVDKLRELMCHVLERLEASGLDAPS